MCSLAAVCVFISFRVNWRSAPTASPHSCCWTCAGSSPSPSRTSRPRPSMPSSWPSQSRSRFLSSARPECDSVMTYNCWLKKKKPGPTDFKCQENERGHLEGTLLFWRKYVGLHLEQRANQEIWDPDYGQDLTRIAINCFSFYSINNINCCL